MSTIATLLRKLGTEHGIEIDPDELSELGLSEEESAEEVDVTDLDETSLDGTAAGAVEIFLSEPRNWLAVKQDDTAEGFWEPIIREGQWAMRPGTGGQKRRSPLKVVPGHSKNQRKEIGLQDILDAFEDPAIEHVTVPTSHENDVTQNTGFIRKLKIVDGTYKPKGTKTEKTVKVLMGLYDIKLPDIKKKIQLGAIASRSAGLLYDYVDTELGKTYPVVLEHVALTNKPWITGMKAFGRKLLKGAGAKAVAPAPVGLSLSDEQPDEADLLAAEDALGETIELADANEITWDKTDDPDWLRGQVNSLLDQARAKKVADAKANQPAGMYVSYDYPTCYRCLKARPGLALISDGWGDGANIWTAPFSIVDGEVQLETDYEKWSPTKQAYISDDSRKPGFDADSEPLSEEQKAALLLAAERERETAMTQLQLAQHRRRTKNSPPVGDDKTTTHPRGGEHMASENGSGTAQLQLSDEARKLVEAAEAKADAAEARAKKLEAKFDTMLGQHTQSSTDAYIAKLKADGFDEEHGFSGVLAEIREQMLADDGEPAVQGEHFADDSNKDGMLSLSEAIKRIFAAFKRGEDGKVALGQQVTQPSETDVLSDEEKDELAEDGKLSDGKPSGKETKEEKSFDSLSDDEQRLQLAKDNPELAAGLGLVVKDGVLISKGTPKGADS